MIVKSSRIYFQHMSKMVMALMVMLLLGLGAVASDQHDGEAHEHEAAVDEHHEGGHDSEEFDLGSMIVHHVSDGNTVHFGGNLFVPLPMIIYNKEHGLDFFMSNKLYDVVDGELKFKPYTTPGGTTYEMGHHGLSVAGAHEGDSGIIDFSITKSILGMFIVLAILFFVFRAAAKGYAKREGKAPKGIQNVVEPLVLFLRDELIIPSVGEKHAAKFTPFLLSMFFFIWIANMLGLVPFLGGFNVTGTLSITLVLATIVFIITTVSGNKHYWGHILWPPGIPLPIKLILVPIEILSIFIKPFVLMVRLTANIMAGHIIILSFVGLILMVGKTSLAGGMGVAVGSVAFMVFMFFIELLVAFIQAYVFTLLTALYFGEAKQEPHH